MKLRLTFRATLMTIIAITAFTFVILMVTSAVVATRVDGQLSTIQRLYLPKVVLRPVLQGSFDRVRRDFQDAVAAHDLEMLGATQIEEKRFLEQLDQARGALDPSAERSLRQAFADYYAAAFATSRRLIDDESGEGVVLAISAMQASQARLVVALDEATAFDGERLREAFAAATRAEMEAQTYRVWISVACLALVVAIWLVVSRNLILAVDQLTKGFARFGAGRFVEPIPVTGHDELSELARQANAMASKIERTVAERQKAEERFRALLEAAPDAIVIAGAQGRIALVNAQAEKLFGFRRDELIGQDSDILLPDRLGKVGHLARRREEANAAESSFELAGRHKDGTEFPIEVSQSPLETDDGVLVSSAIRDVTKRKNIETALQTSNRELEAFSYSVAHDLRSPLRGINGFSLSLIEDYEHKLDDQARDYLRRIGAASDRMGLLIDALLSLSRVSRVELQRELVCMSELAESVMKQIRVGQPERVVRFDCQSGVMARGDVALLRAIFDNLLGNAWKFTGATTDPLIAFGTTPHDGATAYYVKDNGAGFDMAYAGKLFAPFQRLHHVRDFAGTGIGLATVQRIVRRHGGDIWADAAVGAGATFYFTLASSSKGLSS
jgi:PAS domain S-box-containing protein